MKNIILPAIVMAFLLVSCNKKAQEVETTPTIENETVSDTAILKDTIAIEKVTIQKNNDSVVVEKKTTKEPVKKVIAKLHACPMHPEVKGDKGGECPKCGMELTEPVN